MTVVATYNVFAYRKADQSGRDDLTRRGIPEWNLTKALRWALERGCDTVIVELAGTTVAHQTVTHHLCDDPGCPGGCE